MAKMICLPTKYPNVYIDTSAYVCDQYPAELVSCLRRHGRTEVLSGTNNPMMSPKKARELFLHSNAEPRFSLQKQGPRP